MDAHPLPDLEPILTHAHLLATQLRHLRLFLRRCAAKKSSFRAAISVPGKNGTMLQVWWIFQTSGPQEMIYYDIY